MELSLHEMDTLVDMIAERVAQKLEARLSPGKWLTFEEAMRMMKIKSKDTLRKRLIDGDVYGIKDGGKWKVDRESIEDYLNQERV